MRICILTQPFGSNYGGLLQAYALQKVLQNMGHDVTTLRFKPLLYKAPSTWNLYWQTFRRLLSRLRGNKNIIRCNPTTESAYYFEVCRELERFIDTNIHYLRVDTPVDRKKLPEFDLFLVGSDQVWRPVYSPFLLNFYLDFLGDSDAKRVAYAASFGVDVWETDEDTTQIIRPLAQRFDAISVREDSGIRLCKDYLGVDASVMPDPTLLLTKDDYLDLANTLHVPSHNKPYIATYILDPHEDILRLTEQFSHEKHLPIVKLGQFNWAAGADSVESWLTGIANAQYVITDSFHGTLFSLIFQKDFITFNNSNRGHSRFSSILTALNLNDRLIEPDTMKTLVIDPIDYSRVSLVLATLREKGLAYLKNLPRP